MNKRETFLMKIHSPPCVQYQLKSLIFLSRNGLINKKYRRHTNDVQHQQHQKAVTHRRAPGTYSASQLSIEVSELHAGTNGRLEITCLSTIPASVGPGEQYADYKTYSIKGDYNFCLPWICILSDDSMKLSEHL